jgi:hypothetical protein
MCMLHSLSEKTRPCEPQHARPRAGPCETRSRRGPIAAEKSLLQHKSYEGGMNEISARPGNCEVVGASARLPASLHLENGRTRTADSYRVEACCNAAGHAGNLEADAARKTLRRCDRDGVVPGMPTCDRQSRGACRNAEVSSRVDHQCHHSIVTKGTSRSRNRQRVAAHRGRQCSRNIQRRGSLPRNC